ncbi:MAG: hypothetical protein AAFN94_00905 [Pseudomonadota bacterium]
MSALNSSRLAASRFSTSRFVQSRFGNPVVQSFLAQALAIPDLALAVLPSRAASLFEDLAGRTEAEVGDPVGIVLEQSQRAALGPELVPDPDFDNSSAWAERTLGDQSGTSSVANGQVTVTGLSFLNRAERISEPFTLEARTTYLLRSTVLSNAGTNYVLPRGTEGTVGSQGAPIFARQDGFSGPYSVIFTTPDYAGGTDATEIFVRAQNGTIALSDVSLKKIEGNHLTAPSEAARPSLQELNGHRVLQGNGVNSRLEVASRFGMSANPALTVVAGLNTGGLTAADQRVWNLGGTGGGAIAGSVDTTGVSFRFNDGRRTYGALPQGTSAVVTWQRAAGGTYADGQIYVDGVERSITSSVGSGSPLDTTESFNLFAHPNDTSAFAGDIGPLFLYTRDLTLVERAVVEAAAKELIYPAFAFEYPEPQYLTNVSDTETHWTEDSSVVLTDGPMIFGKRSINVLATANVWDRIRSPRLHFTSNVRYRLTSWVTNFENTPDIKAMIYNGPGQQASATYLVNTGALKVAQGSGDWVLHDHSFLEVSPGIFEFQATVSYTGSDPDLYDTIDIGPNHVGGSFDLLGGKIEVVA